MKKCNNCSFQFTKETLDCYFCPQCGAANILNNLIIEKTTANYDPYSKECKPWRDITLLPKRDYLKKKRDQNNKIEKSVSTPWYPPMRQLRVKPPTKKSYLKKNDENIESVKEEIIDNGIIDNINNIINNEEPVVELGVIVVPIERELPKLPLYKETVQPVAIYEAPWLSIKGVVIHISLIEQSLGRMNLQYWLRIGVMTENEQEQDDEQEVDNTLHVLDFISSDVGKFINENPRDWVELPSIDATEYYMSRHMQRILLRLAERVSVGVIVKRNSSLDQEYLVFERKSVNNEDEDYLKELYDYESRLNNKRESTPKKKTLAHLITKECYKIEKDKSNKDYFNGYDIIYNDFIHQLNVKIKYNRNHNVGYCMAQVRISVSYDNRVSDYLSEKDPMKSLLSFENSKIITHFNLHIYPMYIVNNNNETSPTATISFQKETLDVILKACGDNNINEILFEENFKILNKIIRQLSNSVRLENTSDNKVKFVVIGTFSDPPHISCAWENSSHYNNNTSMDYDLESLNSHDENLDDV